VPSWAVLNWERQNGKPWPFKGSGFLFVNEDDRVEVLVEGTDVQPNWGLRFQGLPEGREWLDLPVDTRYDYWFDVVRPRTGTEVLAEYELPLLPPGEKKLKAIGIGRRLSAVLSGWRGQTRTLYLAGDFVDSWPTPFIHRIAGLAEFRRWGSLEVPGGSTSFFWKVYAPLMTRVLDDTWRRKNPG